MAVSYAKTDCEESMYQNFEHTVNILDDFQNDNINKCFDGVFILLQNAAAMVGSTKSASAVARADDKGNAVTYTGHEGHGGDGGSGGAAGAGSKRFISAKPEEYAKESNNLNPHSMNCLVAKTNNIKMTLGEYRTSIFLNPVHSVLENFSICFV